MLKIRPFTELFLLSGVGAAIAVAVDFLVSADGSLLHNLAGVIDIWVVRFTPEWAAMRIAIAALVITGASSVFYFKPLSRKGAFASGFGTVAALAIFLP